MFIERHLVRIVERFPRLKVVLEHITTREAVEFVRTAPDNVAATITAHHLLLNRNAMFAGGIRPHAYCLPVLKREAHRRALVAAATSGNPKFFLGTDSAPHARRAKESACGCAGIYTAHAALELYAEVFEEAGELDKLEAFASFHGPDFYRPAAQPRQRDAGEGVVDSAAQDRPRRGYAGAAARWRNGRVEVRRMNAYNPYMQNPVRDDCAKRVHSDVGVHHAATAIQILKE